MNSWNGNQKTDAINYITDLWLKCPIQLVNIQRVRVFRRPNWVCKSGDYNQIPYFIPKESTIKFNDNSGYDPDVIVLDKQAVEANESR
ncbi:MULTISPECIES: hypothetical protein [unclassified Microcoleus]|jgi:hypothetical protein|uniref:hypothetical protein n=1 Tax=unclassified Microcoleus TaxID=2642155 RepID=UPI002FD42950